MDYMIGVPSRSRVDLLERRKGLWRYIDPMKEQGLPVSLIVRESEFISYREACNFQVLEVPDSYYISDKRQRLLELAILMGKDYLFIIDDDIVLYYRDESLPSKYRCRLEEVIKDDTLNRLLRESMTICGVTFPVVGIPLKQGSQTKTAPFEKNGPLIRFVCYHVPTFKKEKIKLNGMGVPFMSDRYAQMEIIRHGYKSITNCRFAIDDGGTGKPGGCQDTRTAELQSESAKALRDQFPNIIELKVKSGEGFWQEERLDCKIYWNKFLDKNESKEVTLDEMEELYGIIL